MKDKMMKQGSTLFLRGVILFIGLVILTICVFSLPPGIMHEEADGYRYILLGLYVPAVPFYVALYQSLKLLRYIDEEQAFSDLSVGALKVIKYCAVIISGLFLAGSPYLYFIAQRDDAPGVLALGLIIAFASIVIATFAALLQKILRSAIDIKAENDLTV